MLAHQLLEGLLEGFGINAIFDQQLHLFDHLLEVSLEITGGETLVWIMGQALAVVIIVPLAHGIKRLQQIYVVAIDGVQVGGVIDVPSFQGGAGEMGATQVGAETLAGLEVGTL